MRIEVQDDAGWRDKLVVAREVKSRSGPRAGWFLRAASLAAASDEVVRLMIILRVGAGIGMDVGVGHTPTMV